MLGQKLSGRAARRSLVTQLSAGIDKGMNATHQAFEGTLKVCRGVEPLVGLNIQPFQDGRQIAVNGAALAPAEVPTGPIQQFEVVLKPERQASGHILAGVTDKGK